VEAKENKRPPVLGYDRDRIPKCNHIMTLSWIVTFQLSRHRTYCLSVIFCSSVYGNILEICALSLFRSKLCFTFSPPVWYFFFYFFPCCDHPGEKTGGKFNLLLSKLLALRLNLHPASHRLTQINSLCILFVVV